MGKETETGRIFLKAAEKERKSFCKMEKCCAERVLKRCLTLMPLASFYIFCRQNFSTLQNFTKLRDERISANSCQGHDSSFLYVVGLTSKNEKERYVKPNLGAIKEGNVYLLEFLTSNPRVSSSREPLMMTEKGDSLEG